MTREEMYAYGCIFAINSLIEKGSSIYALYVNGKWEKIPWIEIAEWIEEHMQDEYAYEIDGLLICPNCITEFKVELD